MKTTLVSALIAAILVMSPHAFADSLTPPPGGWPGVDGMLGLETTDGHGWLAVKVAIPDSCALSGILWYNNDETVVFPEVKLASGEEGGPPPLTEAVTVAETVSGASSQWERCDFDMPVGAQLGALYVVMEFPAGSGFEHAGAGGGAAVGYGNDLVEPAGWISGDGETWLGLSGEMGFAVLPEFVPYSPDMLVKSLDGKDGNDEVPTSFYGTAGPNPFNPMLNIRFGLAMASKVNIQVFDVRGRRVSRLLNETRPAGHHAIRWFGDDNAGRDVASGVYFVRIEAGSERVNRRVTLVR